VRASYLQIYNEIISDLLKPDGKAPPGGLQIREDKKRGLFVDGLSEWVVRSPEEVYELMRRGAKMRATGATKLNEASSRSHAIFILIVERTTGINSSSCSSSGGGGKGHSPNGSSGTKDGPVIVGKLNLVDLAGSERVAVTGAKGQRLEESKRINSSLSALGNVIAALTDPHAAAAAHAALAARGGLSSRDHHYHPHQNQKAIRHIPYRDSKLTRILEDSLGGNCRTTFLACVSPAAEAFSETLSTLKFAKRTKKVRNAPKINEDGSDHATLLRKYERELRRLRAELASKSKDLVDKRLILEVEEARRREQADKIAAITALERQSQEIARHKAAMAALQTRIASMQSQLLISGQGGGGMAGGGNGGANGGGGGGLKGSVKDNPQVKSLLAAEQAKIRAEYEARLKELEEERRSVAENKAQTERLKSLVIKQRDIMLALASRLSERDDQVLALQSRAEAAEEEVKQLEDKLDAKNAQVISLLRIQQQARNGGGGGGGGGEEEEEEEDGWTISSNTAATNNNGGSTTVPQLEGPQQVTPDMFTDDDDGSRPTSRHGSSSSSDTKDDGEHQQQKEQVSAVKSTTSKSVVDTVASDQKKKKKKNAVPSHQQQEEEEEEELRRRYTVMQEERMALRTILGQKIGVIVDDALATVVEAGKKQQHNGEIMVVQLKKQLEYLSRLVWATADALHEEGQ
jgi:type II secretory pathway pseudopilin PulG